MRHRRLGALRRRANTATDGAPAMEQHPCALSKRPEEPRTTLSGEPPGRCARGLARAPRPRGSPGAGCLTTAASGTPGSKTSPSISLPPLSVAVTRSARPRPVAGRHLHGPGFRCEGARPDPGQMHYDARRHVACPPSAEARRDTAESRSGACASGGSPSTAPSGGARREAAGPRRRRETQWQS